MNNEIKDHFLLMDMGQETEFIKFLDEHIKMVDFLENHYYNDMLIYKHGLKIFINLGFSVKLKKHFSMITNISDISLIIKMYFLKKFDFDTDVIILTSDVMN